MTIRIFEPDSVLHIYNKCAEDRFFLRPTPQTNQLIKGWLARSLDRYPGIDLFAFIFLSNHFHLLLRDNTGDLPGFIGYFKRNLARAINKQIGRKSGSVFERRYGRRSALDDDDSEAAFGYVLTNDVKENLVANAGAGPFCSAIDLALGQRAEPVDLLDRTRRHNASRAGRRRDDEDFTDRFLLQLAPLPVHCALCESQRQKRIRQLVTAREKAYARLRRAQNKRVLGAKNILRKHRWSRPRHNERPTDDKLLCGLTERDADHDRATRQIVADYRDAFARYKKAATRTRRSAVRWPDWTYPPSSLRPVVPDRWRPHER